MINVINVESIEHLHNDEPMNLLVDFYFIAIKRIASAKVKYRQQPFDFNAGIMSFMSLVQVFCIALNKDEELKQSGWVCLIHPDFLWNTPLAKTIKAIGFLIICKRSTFSF